MSDLTFAVLNRSTDEIREYESAFFQSFSKVESNRLARKLWLWDFDSERICTRIPYEDQIICALRDQAGQLRSAMAFNIALRHFQSSAYGFAAPEAPAASFEVLTFFAASAQTLDVYSSFWSNCIALLRGIGLTIGYATTAFRPLPMYRRIGWRILEEREIESEKRYFLNYRIDASRGAERIGPSKTGRADA